MAKKPSKIAELQAHLAALHDSIPEDLHLPSLRENRLEGFAAYFIMILPLLNSKGQTVFTETLLEALFRVFNQRFGGCLIPSARSHPPYWGLWNPSGAPHSEKDYVTTIQVFANPIEPTNRFFSELKQILRTAGNIKQQEILISRFDCWLV